MENTIRLPQTEYNQVIVELLPQPKSEKVNHDSKRSDYVKYSLAVISAHVSDIFKRKFDEFNKIKCYQVVNKIK